MINASLIPKSAVLFDNGATLNCAKTSAGRLVGSFVENTDGDINVGDANSNLYSDGSYLHAFEYIGSDGRSVDTLYRYDATPNVICNILSEPVEVYENGGSFLFNITRGRVWTTCGGMEVNLHMTKNGLGWCKAVPITDAGRIRALLQCSKEKLTASIPRTTLAISQPGPPCEICGVSSIASWRVPEPCSNCGIRLCGKCRKLHDCIEFEKLPTSDQSSTRVVSKWTLLPRPSICCT